MKYIFDGREETDKAIKTGLLLSDELEIVLPQAILYNTQLPLYPDPNNEQYNYLFCDERIKTVRTSFNAFSSDDPLSEYISKTLNSIESMPPKIKEWFQDPVVYRILGDMVSEPHLTLLHRYATQDLGWKYSNSTELYRDISGLLAGLYYYSQIRDTLLSVIDCESLIICNEAVPYAIRRYSEKNGIDLSESINPSVVSLFIPNLSALSFEEIFELREKARDEILAMRYYIQGVSKEYIDSGKSISHMNDYVRNTINKAICDFESKVSTSRITTSQKFLSDLKNPASYIPLITSVFIDIPVQYSLFASLGLITIDTLLEKRKSALEIKRDPLAFMMELK